MFPEKCSDIEDLKSCKDRIENCTKSCPKSPNVQMQNYQWEFEESKWVKVHTIKDLLDVLITAKTTNYQLVGGNTARGTFHYTIIAEYYIVFSNMNMFIYILYYFYILNCRPGHALLWLIFNKLSRYYTMPFNTVIYIWSLIKMKTF